MRTYGTGLIITPWLSRQPERSVTGVFKRLRMLSSAFGQVSERVRVLGIMPGPDVAALKDMRALEKALEDSWGFPVEVAVTASHSRRETNWNHNVSGIADIGEQPDFHFYAGMEQVRAVEGELRREPDIVLVHRLAAMLPVIRSRVQARRVFFDLDDIEHKIRFRTAMLPPRTAGKIFRLSHLPAILKAEHRGARLSRATFVCSEGDRRYLGHLGLSDRIKVVPNAVDIPPQNFARVPEPSLLFLGDLSHGPNHDGAERLIRRILPLLLARRPDARLIVAGAHPDNLPSFARAPGNVEFTGFVGDLAGLYNRSRVVLCPLNTGGGTRIKLIEAAAHSKPMVSTHVGAENLGLEDGREIFLRDDDEAFAEACAHLLDDDDLCQRLGTAAYERVAAVYSRDLVERDLVRMFLEAA